MKQESAIALIHGQHVEKLGRKVSEEELEAMELEMEINNLLLSYRPVKQVSEGGSSPRTGYCPNCC
jgi:hypothetical protein